MSEQTDSLKNRPPHIFGMSDSEKDQQQEEQQEEQQEQEAPAKEAEQPQETPSVTVHVGNLPYSVNEDLLREKFAEFGEVKSVRIPQNDRGQSKGFGFVEFATKDEADKAIAALNETEMDGRQIRVDISDPNARRERRGGDRDRRGGDRRDYDRRGGRDYDRRGGRDYDRRGGRDYDRRGGRDYDRRDRDYDRSRY